MKQAKKNSRHVSQATKTKHASQATKTTRPSIGPSRQSQPAPWRTRYRPALAAALLIGLALILATQTSGHGPVPATAKTPATKSLPSRATASSAATGDGGSPIAQAANPPKAEPEIRLAPASTPPIEAQSQFVYDPAGNLIQVTDPEGKISRFTYDGAGRRIATTYAFGTPDARTWTAEYWPAGQVKKLTKPNGLTIEYAYDNRDRLVSRTYTSGMATLGVDTFTYHPNSLLASAQSGLYNTTIDRSDLNGDYDMANRLVEERIDLGDGGKAMVYAYTGDSLISQITYPGGTVMNRTYNSRRQLHEVALNSVTQATHAYDTAGRRTQRTYANGTGTTWGYDLNSRTTTLSHATSGMMPSVFQAWDYRYTDASNPLVQDDVTPGSTNRGEAYQYDGLHRLTNYQSGTVSENTVPTPVAYQDWTLSKLGNWTAWDNDGTNETRTHNNINALTARSTVANALTYDANSNLIDDGEKYTYEYDANDKLKIVRDRTTTAVVAEYRYDAFGRRVEKEVGSDITRYYHSGEQIIEERNGSDAVVATYSYGDYIDEPLTMDRDSERYYYHTNRMYSTYALTDSMGDVAERYSYTPYGVTTTYDDAYANPQPTSRVDNPFTYTGRELDPETLARPWRCTTGLVPTIPSPPASDNSTRLASMAEI